MYYTEGYNRGRTDFILYGNMVTISLHSQLAGYSKGYRAGFRVAHRKANKALDK